MVGEPIVAERIELPAAVLTENNRLGEFAKISDSFDELMDAARGNVTAIITTASVSHSQQPLMLC